MGIQKRKFQTLPRENKELCLKEFHQAKKMEERTIEAKGKAYE